MSRSVYVYAILTTLALVGAYLSWTHEPDADVETGVTIAPIASDQLESVVLERGEQTVVLEPRADELGEYVWVTSREKAKEKKSEGAKEHESKEAKVKRREYKAGEAAEKVVEKMAPLKAVRKLETDAKLEQFGLDEPKATLTVELKDGETYEFDVGERTYGGHHYYVRDRRSGDLYLMDSGQLSPLETPERLRERDLHDLKRQQIVRVQVQRDSQTVILEQHNRSDRAAAYWAKGGTDKRSEVAKTWLDKFFGLYARTYPTDPPEGLESVFMARLEPEDGKVLTVEVLRSSAKDGEEERFFARSDFTRGLVELSTRSASNVADDLSTLFGGSDKAAEATETKTKQGAGG